MGLFDKKYCDICGEKIKLFGNNKLEDGNLCSRCAKKLSVWFTGFRSSSVNLIKEQLAAREENEKLLASFNPNLEIEAYGSKILIADEKMGRFIILACGEDMKKNPELLEFSRVRDVKLNIAEDKFEVKHKDSNGSMVSFSPKHYSYSYKFNMIITYDSPYFQEIKFPLNSISVNGGTDSDKWKGTSFGEQLKDNLANQFFGQLGIDNSKKSRVVHTDKYGKRDDLPGGYREDGFTTMKPKDIELYQQLEAVGMEIIELLTSK